MNECNSLEIDQKKKKKTKETKVRLDKISEIENYFHQQINQIKLCSKKLGKYVTAFDCIDNVLIPFKCNDWWSICHLFCECCGSTCRNSKCKFYFHFFSNNRNSQKITKHNKKQTEKS